MPSSGAPRCARCCAPSPARPTSSPPDIGQLYDNWFIETCDDDLVPYFAELVGLSLGPALPGQADAPRSAADAIWRRAQVADAIADRRRKGSFSVLEQLAAEATGWPARAVELRRSRLRPSRSGCPASVGGA